MTPKVYAVSDGSGTTADIVARAALSQFATNVEVDRVAGVRDAATVCRIIADAEADGGIIVHTLVERDLRLCMLNEGRARNVATIDLMGPLMARLSELLGSPPAHEPGRLHPYDVENSQRVIALDFAVRHDDGRHPEDLEKAEIVLVGVSRTAKTPITIYLAYRGWRVANVPIALGVEPPHQLFALDRKTVVGLVAAPERLMALRRSRLRQLGTGPTGYANLEHIRAEMAYAYQVFDLRRDWRLVDVTHKSIEEVASEILAVTGRRDEAFDRGAEAGRP